MDEIINILVNSQTLDNVIEDIVSKMLLIAAGLTAVFGMIMIMIVYIKSFLEHGKMEVKLLSNNVLWVVIVIGLLTIYKPITGIIDALMMGVFVQIKMEGNPEGMQELGNALNELELNQEKLLNGETVDTVWGSFKNWVSTWTVSGAVLGTVNFALSTLIKSVGLIMMAFALIITKIFRIIGPLALVFSILPFSRGSAGKWLNGILNAYGAIIIIAICDIILNGFTVALFSSSNGDVILDFNALVVLAFVTAGVYLSAFKYASYIVGDDAGSTAVNMGLQALQAVAGTAMAKSMGDYLQNLFSRGSKGGGDSSASDTAGDIIGG